jgi:S-adenosylmethionine:tRNA ribosyltransferase-isomerase
MKLDEFDFALPPSLIAQYPSPQRGDSRMMVLHRRWGEIEHRAFGDLRDYLRPGDLLVMNNTRVLPARLIGTKDTGGRCELLLIPSLNRTDGEWEVLLRDSRKVKPGTRIQFAEGFYGEVQEVRNTRARMRFFGRAEVIETLQKIGHIPLPPYIRRPDEPLDRERYQSVFAEKDGSIAAPTAGLHFTRSFLESIKGQGVNTAFITLHVGVGTFAPIRGKDVEDHRMEGEWIEITEETGQIIQETKRGGGRVIAVGTTTIRALESVTDVEGRIRKGSQVTHLFIHPPYRFRAIDALITNFHLPKSTLILLVSAFAGKDFLFKAYRAAIEKGYRFYSYGDAMLIL